MKKIFLGLLLVSGFSASAFIDPLPGDTQTTEIFGADLICEGDGALFAINSTDEIVWQSDKGEDQGLQLKVNEFARSRCPHCYQITVALTFLGQTVEYVLTTSNVFKNGESETVLAIIIDGQPTGEDLLCRGTF